MIKLKFTHMFWMFVVTIGTAILAILSGFLQYKEKLDNTQKSLKKEQELTNLYKKLEEKSNQIIVSTTEILTLNKKLQIANSQIVDLQKEQIQGLKDKAELEAQANFNSLKNTVSEIFWLRLWRRAAFEKFTQQEQFEFISNVKSLLKSQLTNQYLISHKQIFGRWLKMYQITSNNTKFFPAGEVTLESETGSHKLSQDELLKYNNSEFMDYIKQYNEFIHFMMDNIKGIWS